MGLPASPLGGGCRAAPPADCPPRHAAWAARR